jgi:transposase
MAGFIEEADRGQLSLLPGSLDDWVGKDNPVRVIDAFVDGLDLKKLGFETAEPLDIGRPGYHPSIHLKLYIYGYLYRVQSSRRLERECHRNLEVMWLLGRLAPDHKTIADFRKDNGAAIKKVCGQFVELCRSLGLLSNASVAIDGSKFKAVNNRDKNFTQAKVEKRRTQLEESVARYLAQLDTADRQEPSESIELKKTHLKEKLEKLKSEMQKLEAIEQQVLASPDKQISLTDPDSRSMATSGRGSGVVGYNVQIAVDTEHGYFNGEEIKACDDAGVTVTLPKPMTSGAKSAGRFGKQDFVYLADENVYRCPAGEKLTYRYTNEENGQRLHRYWTNACRTCALKAKCTEGHERRIARWEHEAVVEAVQKRLDENPDAMRTRREVVEHPFGTMKMRMGATHFLCKTLPKVATEMALCVLTYNLTRVLNIFGVEKMMEAIAA